MKSKHNKLSLRERLERFDQRAVPIPVYGARRSEEVLVMQRGLTTVLEENAAWLQERPRSTNFILQVIFPDWKPEPEVFFWVVREFNLAMFDLGYTPDDRTTPNPRWLWLEGKYPSRSYPN